MQVNIPTPSLAGLSGWKTYIALALGAIVIAANHYGFLPPDYAPNLDPNNWANDEYKLLLGATGRSALASIASSFGVAGAFPSFGTVTTITPAKPNVIVIPDQQKPTG